ncbi:MAG: tRNA-dihydrouridine synthase family protein [Clostridia bacterium]|nr:tRNA-dihydrouridine synthase family protein [Clostridia bacterium]
MKYYLAPMEGLTGYIYRNAYNACYHPMDKYFTPFLSPKANSGLSFRELNDILPEHNRGLYLVPQILTNQAEDFMRMAMELREYGYTEVNLNLGCPSGTVVSKHKGAGFLEQTDRLDRLLDEVCTRLEQIGMELSVKTRLGMTSPDEFPGLLEIYNRYPIKELILHPRIRTDYYKNTPNMPAFRVGFEGSRAPVCYNGDIFTVSDYETLCGEYPKLDRVMLGRGIISNPGLLDRIAAGADSGDAGTGKETLRQFHQMVYEGYREIMSGDRNVLFKMKELWACMIQIFSDNGKYIKRIKKSQRLEEYEAAVAAVFRDLDIMEGAGFRTY